MKVEGPNWMEIWAFFVRYDAGTFQLVPCSILTRLASSRSAMLLPPICLKHPKLQTHFAFVALAR